MTGYALMIKLVDGASSAHLFNPYAYFGHLWFYFDIHIFKMADPSIWTLSIIARRFIRMEWNIQIKKKYIRNFESLYNKQYSITKSYILNIKIRPLVTEYTLMISWTEQVPPTRLILMHTSVTRGLILIFKIYD